MRSSVSNRRSISAWPPAETSWWWNSQSDPHLLEHDDHPRAQVGVGVAGRGREVALLGAQRVAEVAAEPFIEPLPKPAPRFQNPCSESTS